MKISGKVIFGAMYLIGTTFIINHFFFDWIYDDTFITYRYAANLQNGLGFVYNPDERVLSTTTPLFTLLLALLGNLWADLPDLAKVIGAFSLACGGIFLWDLAHSWKSPLVGWGGLLLYPTFPLVVSTLGSETALYLSFCLGAIALYARQRYGFSSVFAALAILARPDGILVAIVLGMHYVFRVRHPIPWIALTLFFVFVIPWFAFAWVYFGSPLPVTLAAKQHQGSMAISQTFAPGFLEILEWYAWWPYLLHAGLSVAGMIFMFRYARSWILFLSWTLLYFLAYSALGVSGYFWYYAPLVPGFIVLIGLGISSVSKFFSVICLRDITFSHRTAFYHLISLSLLLVLVIAQADHLRQLRERPYHRLFIDNRMAMYRDVGDWLRKNTPQYARVGTLEVGIIGYYAQRTMIDFAGLIQPSVSDQLTVNATYEDIALWAVENYSPDYLILFDTQFPTLEQGYVASHCMATQYFLGESYEYPFDLIVYVCK